MVEAISDITLSCLEHVIVHYRFIFVMFLLPVSCLYDLWFYTRSKIVFALSSAPDKHKEKVADVQHQVSLTCYKGWKVQISVLR